MERDIILDMLKAVDEAGHAELCRRLRFDPTLLSGEKSALTIRRIELYQAIEAQPDGLARFLAALEQVLGGRPFLTARAPSTSEDYTHDLYVSCHREGGVGKWLHNHFLDELRDHLPANLPYQPPIYVREGGGESGRLSEGDQRALGGARCLLAVWSPEYFRCSCSLSEWQTFRAREGMTGFDNPTRGEGLIYPVVYWDGEHFPEEAQRREGHLMHNWAKPAVAFKTLPLYVDFQTAMQELSYKLSIMIQRVPPWDQNWPTLDIMATRRVEQRTIVGITK
jgi:hypothetical protein